MTTPNDPQSFPEGADNQNIGPIDTPSQARLGELDLDLKAILRKFFACNPLYLLSAALLLYSFCLVSGDVHSFNSDISRLGFNLGSLQFYELLLVLTAIWLARRAAWYDSTLLAGLENLLLLVPFILLSEAALIDATTVWTLCGAAVLIALTRLTLLKKFFKELNFPNRLMGLSALMLVANAALLVTYRVLHQSKVGKQPDWGAAYEMNQYAWWIILPLLISAGSLVPILKNPTENTWPRKAWLPISFFLLWLTGTCVHFYSLAYVYDFQLRPDMIAPALWMFGWMLWVKLSRLAPGMSPGQRAALWSLPILATLFAWRQPEKTVFLALTGINLTAFVWFYREYRTREALHCMLISAVAVLAGLPEQWGSHLVSNFSREVFVAGAGALLALIWTTASRNPKLGLLGACLAGLLTGLAGRSHPETGYWLVQNSLVYLLIHSIRWEDGKESGAGLLRGLAGFLWFILTLIWVGEGKTVWPTLTAAGLVMAYTLAAWRIWGLPLRTVLVITCPVVALVWPGLWLTRHLSETPAGVLVALASFVLFGLGTLAAATKNYWAKRI